MRKRARPPAAHERRKAARVAGGERARICGRAGLGALALLGCGGREGAGSVSRAPDFTLDGSGTNVDSLAFWEAPDARDTLLFVTAKANQRVEVWRFPFVGNEQAALTHPSFTAGAQVNGIAVDQTADLLYVAVSQPASTVSVFSLPQLAFVRALDPGMGPLGSEPNLALLHRPDGTRWLYVSADDRIGILDASTGARVGGFEPSVGLETMLADDREQLLYVPDENGRSGVTAYDATGIPYPKGASVRFGTGAFEADAEGIVLYRCESAAGDDDGRGFLVVSDQRANRTQFELFDRSGWRHLGAFTLDGVSNTDGIGSTQQALPGHPQGIFAAIDDDTSAVGIGWHRILAATGLGCGEAPPSSGR
jgi:myo-inositol-hexaphosphate 3-phosphohydrolase